ncbi:MAG: helix-hairpin-helix domain-containing protein [Planctomycetota bacterium]|nr:helix-hairpin-helix domain-containing protein [Planctomycetota bacterium]
MLPLKSAAHLHDAKKRDLEVDPWSLSRGELAAWVIVALLLPVGLFGARAAFESTAGESTFAIRPLHASPGTSTTGGAKLDLNRATAGQLRLLPGIGTVLAERIVRHREQLGPYRTPWDLAQVPGISRARVEQLLPLVEAEAP